ncbi:MAG: phosphate ABC transporter substrate-binding protein, partial [Chloroflexota bacterium]
RAPACGFTSYYPTIPGMIAQSGDLGVAGYVQQGFAEGAIGYVNYSYALGAQFPVAKVLNAAGYYTEPKAENVAVSLLKAQINQDASSDEYLTQKLDGVYSDPDRRNYQLSSYSYFILPTKIQGQFNLEKGKTLGAFTYYAMCQAQQQSASLGYSPMPINLVQASFEQIRKIPGVVVQDVDISKCKNPTFSADGTNVLAKNAPMPQECDKKGTTQCATGTGGAKATTPVAGGGKSGGAKTGGGSRSGGTASGGGASGDSASGSGTTGAEACDPDTGSCDTAAAGDGSTGGDAVDDSAQIASASPTVLAGASGWSGSQVLIALVLILTLALVFAPAAAWQHFAKGERT